VETRALIQAVRRNAKRFPRDFMFQLSAREFKFVGRSPQCAVRIHRTGRGDAVERPAQQARH
jgi:anthranilate/para-aminobenzoate synthase component I